MAVPGHSSGNPWQEGLIIVLGLEGAQPIAEQGVGSGIHGGEIFVRGPVDELCLGNGAKQAPVTEEAEGNDPPDY